MYYSRRSVVGCRGPRKAGGEPRSVQVLQQLSSCNAQLADYSEGAKGLSSIFWVEGKNVTPGRNFLTNCGPVLVSNYDRIGTEWPNDHGVLYQFCSQRLCSQNGTQPFWTPVRNKNYKLISVICPWLGFSKVMAMSFTLPAGGKILVSVDSFSAQCLTRMIDIIELSNEFHLPYSASSNAWALYCMCVFTWGALWVFCNAPCTLLFRVRRLE